MAKRKGLVAGKMPRMMTGNAASFGLGVLGTLAVGAMAPGLGKSLRPLGKKAIKFGLRAGEDVARRVAESKEHFEDLGAEARAEYEAERSAEEEESGTLQPEDVTEEV